MSNLPMQEKITWISSVIPQRLLETGHLLFDKKEYIRFNQDVAAALRAGDFVDAFEHYVLYGVLENRILPKRRLALFALETNAISDKQQILQAIYLGADEDIKDLLKKISGGTRSNLHLKCYEINGDPYRYFDSSFFHEQKFTGKLEQEIIQLISSRVAAAAIAFDTKLAPGDRCRAIAQWVNDVEKMIDFADHFLGEIVSIAFFFEHYRDSTIFSLDMLDALLYQCQISGDELFPLMGLYYCFRVFDIQLFPYIAVFADYARKRGADPGGLISLINGFLLLMTHETRGAVIEFW